MNNSKIPIHKKIIVGLSGGVDSSVAAYLLKKQGYDVEALFMKNWHDTTGVLKGDCPWDDDMMFAEMVADKLEIPFHHIDLSKEYRERVVDYMFNEYKEGRTPNPDVLCNREIKFDLFAREARRLGGDMVATGHYCRKEETISGGKTIYRLLAGVDKNKDQSYFLCQISQKQLSNAIFPLGNITKPEVRKIASELDLATAKRKDSQGICFVGKVDLPVFLQQQLAIKKGDTIEIPQGFYDNLKKPDSLEDITKEYPYKPHDGIKIGEHNGAHFFTIGQRKGLNIGGKTEPLFVIDIDTNMNIIYTGMGKSHTGLFRKGLFVKSDEIHWLRNDQEMKPGGNRKMLARIRYRQPLQEATLHMKEEGMYIVFAKSQRGVARGQFVAWYDGEELIGSGVIY
ncbi:MAG: tRNA 2-thiouridine(34) synthase MnmA [Bacteroidetes bacterium]|nr:tRNA 2-thiouridine(34) synthase MnmA [Bacteroidota bacterium]